MSESVEHALQPQNLEVRLADTEKEIESALRLRYEVFVEEEKNLKLRNDCGLETDDYDPYCDHLVVKDLETDQIIGTYRLLPGSRAVQGIGFYSETEFDLTAFAGYKERTLELGRSCVAPPYRNGRAIQLLWEGIAKYIAERQLEYLVGCASVHFRSPEDLNEVYSLLKLKQVWTDRYGIKPLPTHIIRDLQTVDLSNREKEIFRKLPPLMKGYQWLGAEIGGDPAYDPVFDTVDFFIVLDKTRMSRRYKKHFSG